MGNIELRITLRDWFSVLAIGVSFSTLLSLFGYYLLGLDWKEGGQFGLALGFFITLYSMLFITSMNRFLLPHLPKPWWDAIAALFSFLSGFLGALSSYTLLQTAGIKVIQLFVLHPFQSASVIGVLTYLMGALIYRFVKTRNEKEHIDNLFVQSRVRSLETQLNPHFLYNALNSLAELIHQDPLKAEEAVIKISSFLRNTMVEAATIPLIDELRNARDYIDLENIRFNGKIVLFIESDPHIGSTLVPKFSIQLLCENAIKHGMGNTPGPFTLSIRCQHDNGLIITVSNNGAIITSPEFGIGLSNLQERLNHLAKGRLSIDSFDPPTYRITLKENDEHPHRR